TSGTTSPATTSLDDGTTKYTWAFADLPSDPGEPQSLPWPRRSPRLRFTTCPRAKVWVSELLVSVENAVQPSGAVQTFAEKVVGDEPDPAEKARLLSKKLRDVFNFVASLKTVRALQCRSVTQVFDTNYGSPLESAALLVGMLRAVHVKATTEVAVDSEMWDADVPTHSGFAGIVVVIDVPDGPMYVHPQRGEFLNPGHWGGHTLLSLDTAEDLRATPILARGQNEKSRLNIAGQLAVGLDGKVNGELRLHLTGGFYDPLRLRNTDKQKALLERLVGRLLVDFKITKHSITTLSDDSLKATVQVAAEELPKVGAYSVLQFGEGPLFLTSGFPLPVGGGERKTAVRTRGALIENIDLILELPQDWPAPTDDTKVVRESGDWGVVVQERITSGHTIRFRRTIDIPTDTLRPIDFAELRQALNTLRTIRHTHLLIVPQP
ncbi:MAG: transglutaminase domain-containing protein, partial [Planctomycetes bacterium]|nr:transglutaminase domain-containing protein [Planctomycetota bacterium]